MKRIWLCFSSMGKKSLKIKKVGILQELEDVESYLGWMLFLSWWIFFSPKGEILEITKHKPFMTTSRSGHVNQILPMGQRGGMPGTSGKSFFFRCKHFWHPHFCEDVLLRVRPASSPIKGEIMGSLRMTQQKVKSLGLW